MGDLDTLAALISAVGVLCGGLAALVSAILRGRRKRPAEKKRATAMTESDPGTMSSNVDATF